MANLRVPSLQHLARNARSDPLWVKRLLIQLAKNSPSFNYVPLIGAVRDMLVFGHPYEQIVEGIRRGIKREDVRKNYLGVLPLLQKHFEGVAPNFVQVVERRYYPVGQGLMVPFEPPLIYGVGGRIHLPWFIFWHRNPFVNERLSLFVSIVKDVMMQDPELEDAKFEILDFSAPGPKQPRTLKVIDARDVSSISEERKLTLLSAFVEGFLLAKAELSDTSHSEQEHQPRDEVEKDDQLGLFDGDL